MSDLLVKVIPTTELAARAYCLALNRAEGLVLARLLPDEFRGEGRHVARKIESVCGWRKHATLSRWYVGPIPRALATILDGRVVRLRDGRDITLDFTTNVFDLDVIEAAFHAAQEQEETGD